MIELPKMPRDALQAMERVSMTEWISVDDKMPSTEPDENGCFPMVLVHWQRDTRGDSNTLYLANHQHEATHWVPLPTPPESKV